MNVTSYGKRDFEDIIKLKILRLYRIIWVGPKCNHEYPYKREAEIDLIREERVMRPLKQDATGLDDFEERGNHL